MDDYYGFAAFFPQIGRKRAADPRESIVFDSGSGEVKHPIGNANVAPKFLGAETPKVSDRDRRESLAKTGITSVRKEIGGSRVAPEIVTGISAQWPA